MKEGSSGWKKWKKIPDSDELTVSHTVAGLTNGTEYGFQVRARSSAGRSRPSPASSATPEALPGMPQGVTVPQSWEMIPKGTDVDGNPLVAPGQGFRLMFLTSSTNDAASSHISYYNDDVQLEAQSDHNYRLFKDQFRAIISTAAVHARDNVSAEGDDVPVFWNGGGLVAWSTGGLFRGRWLDHTPRFKRGAAIPDDQKADAQEVWTGSTSLGYAWNIGGSSDLRLYAGAGRVMVGNPYKSGQEINGSHPPGGPPAASNDNPIYAISPVITVSATDIWATTLSGNMQDGEVGCHNSASGWVRCSDEVYLHDDDFTYNGVTYNVIGLRRMGARVAGLGGGIYLGFDDPDGGVKAALEGLTLNVAGHKLPFSRATESIKTPSVGEPYTRLTWSFQPHPNAAWREYQDIAVSITRTTKPSRPTGLEAEAGANSIKLSWHHKDDTITKRQYRQRAGAGAWGAWTDIPESGAGQRHRTFYAVTGLNAGVTYTFQLRSVNALGNSPGSAWAAAAVPTVVWSATLTAASDPGYDITGAEGCSADFSGNARCSVASILTDDDFSYGGVTYTVDHLILTPDSWELGFAGLGSAQAKTALAALTLHLDDRKFTVSSATTPYKLEWRNHHRTRWNRGQKISVALTLPVAVPTTSKPTGFAAAEGNAQATLSWDNPNDASITKYQYRQKAGAGAWRAWTDIPDSGAGQANALSYTLTGLDNAETYAFQVRAVNAAGPGPESDEATATPSGP